MPFNVINCINPHQLALHPVPYMWQFCECEPPLPVIPVYLSTAYIAIKQCGMDGSGANVPLGCCTGYLLFLAMGIGELWHPRRGEGVVHLFFSFFVHSMQSIAQHIL